jgi:glycine/D-amino acid oxidase-like deaminating enzyme
VEYREISAWLDRAPDPAPALERDTQADVVVIGAGVTGLSTALSLRDAEFDVVVLERGFAGCGATARSGGYFTPTIGRDLPTIVRTLGQERGGALLRFSEAAIEYAEELIGKHEIECDYVASGNIMGAVHPSHARRLREAADAALELGTDAAFLDGGAMRERGFPAAFSSGLHERKGGTLNPAEYVFGLRRAALAAGVRLYEDTAVTGLEEGPRIRVRTPGGEVTAAHAVLATNAFAPQLGPKRRAVLPVMIPAIETAPLPGERRWPGREGIMTSHQIMESYRLTERGSLVAQVKAIVYRFGSRLAPADHAGALRRLERAFRERLPELAEVPIAYSWGGWLAMTYDFLPRIGSAGRCGNIHYALGYNGHGLTQGALMGPMLVERIQGRRHPHERALERRDFDWPVEPLRWLGYHAVSAPMALADRWMDWRIRRLAASGRTAVPSAETGETT